MPKPTQALNTRNRTAIPAVGSRYQRNQASIARPRINTGPPTGKVGFLAATQVPVGGAFGVAPFPTIQADVNGDGKPDILNIVQDDTAMPWVLSVSVLLSNGDGTFRSPVVTHLPLGNYFQFFAGDVNGDGKADLIIVHPSDYSTPATADVWIGNGDGTFTVGGTFSITSNSLAGGTLADVNGDGKLDLVVEDESDPANVWMLFGNGDGTFQSPVVVPLGGEPGMPSIWQTYVVFADLNGDGLMDIAQISAGSGQFTVYLATSATTFAAAAYYNTPDGHFNANGVAVGDLNGDGKPDVVVPNGLDDNFTIYMNNGDGTFQTGVYHNTALSTTPVGDVSDVCPLAVTIADVNGDGRSDLVIVGQSSDVIVFLGNGDGTFQLPSVAYAAGGFTTTPPVVADFDGDGIPDVIVSDGEFSVVYLRGHGDGSFQAARDYFSPVPYGTHSYSLGIASGDFNGDGQPDFVVTNTGDTLPGPGFTVFLSQPDGSLSEGVDYGNGDLFSAAVADFDMDGHLDIAATDLAAGTIRIFKGVGDGSFTAGGQFATDSSNSWPAGAVARDLNHDGYPDLAVVNSQGTNVGILVNDGTGNFTLSANYPLSSRTWYPSDIVAADLRGTGDADLIVPLSNSTVVAVLFSNGDGTFQPETDVPVDSNPGCVAVGDFNKDGKLDLAVTVGEGVDVLLGNGDGTFQPPQFYLSSLQNSAVDVPMTYDIKTADIDMDGNPDLVYTNPEFGTVGVLFGVGDGTFYNPVEFPAGGFVWDLAIADLNQDVAPDVVAAGDNFSGVTVLLNANGSAVQPNYVLSSNTYSAVLTPGSSTDISLNLTSRNLYSGSITLGCDGLPPGMSCAFTPQSVLLQGNTQARILLTISAGPELVLRQSNGVAPGFRGRVRFASLSYMGLLALAFIGIHRNRGRQGYVSRRLLAVCAVLLLTGCGGSRTSGGGVTTRTYVVHVSATGAGGLNTTSHAVDISVTVR